MPSLTYVREINGDPTYPIFHISANWFDDDCPEGGEWEDGNATGFHKLYRTHPGLGMVEADARIWWQKYAKSDRFKDKHPRSERISVKLLWWETWSPCWFAHETFNLGLSDSEVLASFSRYVNRMEQYNRLHGRVRNGVWVEPLCLMGAEDRWRWCGFADGDPDGERTAPPCRCKHCKEQGKVRIVH